MIEPTALCDLAEFDRRHPERLGVGWGDVPVLIQRQAAQRSTVRLRSIRHRDTDSVTRYDGLNGTVRRPPSSNIEHLDYPQNAGHFAP